MQTVRLALIGFGNVGQGLAQILHERGDVYARQFGLRFVIVVVNDLLRGCAYNPHGLDLAALLQAGGKGADALSALPDGVNDWDALATITRSDADVVVEEIGRASCRERV